VEPAFLGHEVLRIFLGCVLVDDGAYMLGARFCTPPLPGPGKPVLEQGDLLVVFFALHLVHDSTVSTGFNTHHTYGFQCKGRSRGLEIA